MFRPRSEGAGNAGRSMHPQPRMQNKKAYEHSHHGHTGLTRHSPRNGFNGFLRALPGDRYPMHTSLLRRSSNTDSLFMDGAEGDRCRRRWGWGDLAIAAWKKG